MYESNYSKRYEMLYVYELVYTTQTYVNCVITLYIYIGGTFQSICQLFEMCDSSDEYIEAE